MTVEIKSSRHKLHYVKLCVYGQAGVGKTVLCATAPKPLIISAEAGLLSLADRDVDIIEITSLGELREAFAIAQKAEHETICIDSISDVAEQVLDLKMDELEKAAKETGKLMDPRQGYGKLAIEMMRLTRAFRNLNKHIIFTAKLGSIEDDLKIKYGPMLPGKQYTQNLPYLMDLLFAMRIDKEGNRYLQTQPDIQWSAKDRSGKLDKAEKPDLSQLFTKVIG